MENTITVRAGFTGCNIKSGKTVMQFELDGEDRGALPTLARLTGSRLTLTLTSDQQVLFVDRDSGEVLDEQEALELPEAVIEEVSDPDDEGTIWGDIDDGWDDAA